MIEVLGLAAANAGLFWLGWRYAARRNFWDSWTGYGHRQKMKERPPDVVDYIVVTPDTEGLA